MSKPADKMPPEIASAVNMLAHPLAGMAAMSAIGFGVASQALGMWTGAAAGMAEASERLLRALDESAAQPAKKAAAANVRARAQSVMEQAQSFAREVGEAADEAPAAPVGSRVRRAQAAPKRSPAVAAPADGSAQMRRPAAVAKPAAPDDLKAISGIGPKLEQVLNGLGIWTYAQVSGWSAEEAAWVDDYLGLGGRIGRDGWIGQADALARGATRQ